MEEIGRSERFISDPEDITLKCRPNLKVLGVHKCKLCEYFEKLPFDKNNIEDIRKQLSLELVGQPGYKEIWEEAKIVYNSKKTDNILQSDESFPKEYDIALIAYTMNRKPQLYIAFQVYLQTLGLNTTLPAAAGLPQLLSFFVLITQAMEYLRNRTPEITVNTLYRGVNRKYDCSVGDVISFQYFTSASKNKDICIGFLGEGVGTVFEINGFLKTQSSKTPVQWRMISLEHHSVRKEEEEVLLSSCSSFVVISVQDKGSIRLVNLYLLHEMGNSSSAGGGLQIL